VPEALPIPLIGLMKAKFPQEGGHCLAYGLDNAKVPQAGDGSAPSRTSILRTRPRPFADSAQAFQ
jgi:hypothetical protein